MGSLFAMGHPHTVLFGRTFLWFDVAGGAAIAGLAVTFLAASWRGTRLLYREEPVRHR
jgi:uncharacterized membrane protein YccC